MKMFKRKEKASTTLEAIIVMPTILIIIFAVFFAFQLMYQHVVLEYAASYGATRGAMMWDYKSNELDFTNGTVGGKVGIYNNIEQMLNNSGIEERKKMIKEQTEKIVESLTVFGGDVKVEPVYEGKLIGRTISVSITQDVNIPFEALLAYFDGGDMKLKAQSTAALYDPDEYIRNIDYIYELAATIADEVADKFDTINNKRKK